MRGVSMFLLPFTALLGGRNGRSTLASFFAFADHRATPGRKEQAPTHPIFGECTGDCQPSVVRQVCSVGLLFPVLLLACLASRPSLAQSLLNVFGNSVPQTPVDPDTGAVTLGVKFWSTQTGTISGIRFYRGAENSNGYTVELFTADGSLLASSRTSQDTCAVPCWEQVNFASPLPLAANTTYVAAYYTSNGHYADDAYGLTNGKTSGPLIVPASAVVGGNGVYTYSTGFPQQVWKDSNYYVDVAFTPTTPTPSLTVNFNPPKPSISASAPAGTLVATITAAWSDGSPFTGSLGFAAPYSDDHGTFAISGNNLVINPLGAGVSADGNTTQNVTILATQ
jgi:hypothetical protein